MVNDRVLGASPSPSQESLTAVMEVIELGVSGTVSSVSLSMDIHCTADY